MFSNLNPLDRPTAILEIVIMLLGAALIGFLIAWIARKPRKVEAAADPKKAAAASSKAEARVTQLEKALETAKAEKSRLEAEAKAAATAAKETETQLRKELDAAKSAKPQDSASQALENAKRQVADLEKALAAQKERTKEAEAKLTAAQSTPSASPNSDIDALRAEIATLKTQLSQPNPLTQEKERLQQELAAAQEENRQLKAEAQKQPEASADTEALRTELGALRAEHEKLLAQAAATPQENDRVRELERHLREQQRETFNLQTELAKVRNEKTAPAADSSKELDWLKKEKEDLERDVKDLESQIDRLEKENSDLRSQARDKSAAGPALEKLTKERDRLRAEVEKLKRGAMEQPSTLTADFSHLGTATADEKDELTRINGIGPVVESKLNQLGIYTFAQISRFSATDMDTVDQVLQLFPGRVKRENWVAQAAALAK